MAAATPLPVTVIGGYLGAGKTTLVNHLLRHAGGRRLAVLVNDFGALPIDADLIEGADGGILAIAGGCVCCAYGSDLIEGLEAMAARRPRPDHVVVEASGVALPEPIAQSVQLLAPYRRDAIVVLADAETVRQRAADRYVGDTVTRQLAAADLVVVNKQDLVGAAGLDATLAWMTEAAPLATVIATQDAAVAPDLVLGPARSERLLLSPPRSHDRAWDAVALTVPGPVDAEGLARALAAVELGLARAKGIVEDAGGRVAIQVVGRRWSVEPAGDAGTGDGRLVAIVAGSAIPTHAIEAAIGRALLAER